MPSLGDFDARTVEPSSPRENLPPGQYLFQIVRSDMKATQNGGSMLVLEMDVMEGQHAGRKLWENLNLKNSSEKAVEIARSTLSAICRAIGDLDVKDSEQLHFKPFRADVEIRPAANGYGPSNKVKKYHPAAGMPAASRSVSAAAPVAAPATSTTPPWRRTAAA